MKFEIIPGSNTPARVASALKYAGDYKIHRTEQTEWKVIKKEGYTPYTVELSRKGFTCSCPDFRFRRQLCKHIFLILLNEELPELATYLFIQWPELTHILRVRRTAC